MVTIVPWQKHVFRTHRDTTVDDIQEERDVTHDVPFWIGNGHRQRYQRILVRGIKEMTTCQHVMDAILRSVHQRHSAAASQFCIVEKWRQMERKLNPNESILEVYEEWGNKSNEVNFIFKKNSAAISSDASEISSTLKGMHTRDKSSNRKLKALHATLSYNLLILAMGQRDTIQKQLLSLRKAEKRIANRSKSHRSKSENLEIIKLDSDSSETRRRASASTHKRLSKSSETEPLTHLASNRAECSPPLLPNLEKPFKNCVLPSETELMFRISQLDQKLGRERKYLQKMGLLQIEEPLRIVPLERGPLTTDPPEAGTVELRQAEVELKAIKQLTEDQTVEIEQNERLLNLLDSSLESKHECLELLARLIESADTQLEGAIKKLKHIAPEVEEMIEKARNAGQVSRDSPAPKLLDSPTPSCRNQPKLCDSAQLSAQKVLEDELVLGHESLSESLEQQRSMEDNLKRFQSECEAEDNDSNSDTGISSIHSSTDDKFSLMLPSLNTLV